MTGGTMPATPCARIRWYATAPRASAGQLRTVENGQLCRYWVPRLRGRNVMWNGRYKFPDRDKAVGAARAFREACRQEVEALAAGANSDAEAAQAAKEQHR